MSSQKKSHSKGAWASFDLALYRSKVPPEGKGHCSSQLTTLALEVSSTDYIVQMFPGQFRESWVKSLREKLQAEANNILLEIRMARKQSIPGCLKFPLCKQSSVLTT